MIDTERSNHAVVIILNIENINLQFCCFLEVAFKIHLAQKPEDGHDASVYMHALYVCVRERTGYNRQCIY